MTFPRLNNLLAWMLLAFAFAAQGQQTRIELFDVDPQWEGFRNRLVPDTPPSTRQSFGYRQSQHAGGARGEIGGWIQRSTTPASYAKKIAPVSLTNHLSARGKFAVKHNEGGSGVMFGWFNAQSRGWRMPNSLVIRIDGNGGKYWLFFEYGTRHWLTGGGATFEGRYQTTKTKPFTDGPAHSWQLDYRQQAEGGEIELLLDCKSYVAKVPAAHVADGAVFDRFGIVNQQLTGDGMEIYLDDVELNGETFAFDNDPQWEGNGNEVQFADRVRRPFHDFGFSPTQYAGSTKGEVGGVIWRDEKPAFYGASISPLTLQHELFASGKIVFRGAGSDSAAYVGFFDAESKRNKTVPDHEREPANLLAILIEGRSSIGHYFRAGYRNGQREGMFESSGPTIRPDGTVHSWTLHYTPNAADQDGEIALTFDDHTQKTRVRKEHKTAGARFDRFGILNVQAGGHFVEIYLDDLKFTTGP
jgi:hypothetical protein